MHMTPYYTYHMRMTWRERITINPAQCGGRPFGLRDASDEEIYAAARAANAVVLTKDADFVVMLERHGPPPRVLWVTLGNTANARMRGVLKGALRKALDLLRSGEALVEIGEPSPRTV